ncbi:MAG: carbohydrate ABC transporter permease, partial [Clostridia bacterium]
MTAATMKARHMTHRRRGVLITHIVLLIGSFIMLFPFVWMILTSFKTQGESIMVPPIIFPTHWDLTNYSEVLRT